jgi:hypothetical protein
MNRLQLLALVLAVLFHTSPASAIPAGTVALQEWFLDVIPRVFPNATDNWQTPFEDGTLDQNIVFKMNDAAATTGLAAMRVCRFRACLRTVRRTDEATT